MIYRRCSRCGKRNPSGTTCECIKRIKHNRNYKKYDEQRRGTQEYDFYSTREWRSLRKRIKLKYNGIDIYSYYVYGLIEYADTVHHIIPVKDDYSLRLDVNNLIPLTSRNHQLVHTLMDSGKKEKTEIIEKLKEIKALYDLEFEV